MVNRVEVGSNIAGGALFRNSSAGLAGRITKHAFLQITVSSIRAHINAHIIIESVEELRGTIASKAKYCSTGTRRARGITGIAFIGNGISESSSWADRLTGLCTSNEEQRSHT
jgi:hypothetical protein